MPAGGLDWDAVLAAMHAWVFAGSGLSDQKVVWGQQDSSRPESPAIVMRISNISELDNSWVDYEDNPLQFDDITVTADAGTDTFAAVAHGLVTGDGPVQVVSTLTVPGGTEESTDYWVVVTDDDNFQLAETFQDAMAAVPTVIGLIDAGTGTITVVATEDTVRAGEEIVAVARCTLRLTLELRCHADPVIGTAMAVALLQRVRMRREWPSQHAILKAAGLALQRAENIIAVSGTRDDFLFEPRAHLLVYFDLAAEESEALGIIERVLLTNQIVEPDVEFAVPE